MSESNERRALDWFTPFRFAILLALLIFAAFPQVVLGLETFVARDYGFFAFPLAHFQRQCFWRGELPFWNPYNNCGVPFLAQWNTMPLYPPSLIYLLLPLTWSLSFFFSAAFMVRRFGNVFSRASLDGASFRRRVCRSRIFLQRHVAQPAHVAESHGNMVVDAVGRAGGRTRVARRRAENFSRRNRRRVSNARGRTGNYFLHLDFAARTLDSTIRVRRIAAQKNVLAISARHR